MATSRLAHHLPSIFGPSRRAAWRLSALRRALAAGVLLLALHLSLSATRAEQPAAAPEPPETTGAALSLPLAAPAGHLASGDEVGVYLPGRTDPLVTSARVLSTVEAGGGAPVVRLTLERKDIGPLLREMGSESGGSTGFVVVRGG